VGQDPGDHPEPDDEAGQCGQEPLHQLVALTEASTLSALNETRGDRRSPRSTR
jgi:hypothetical protein